MKVTTSLYFKVVFILGFLVLPNLALAGSYDEPIVSLAGEDLPLSLQYRDQYRLGLRAGDNPGLILVGPGSTNSQEPFPSIFEISRVREGHVEFADGTRMPLDQFSALSGGTATPSLRVNRHGLFLYLQGGEQKSISEIRDDGTLVFTDGQSMTWEQFEAQAIVAGMGYISDEPGAPVKVDHDRLEHLSRLRDSYLENRMCSIDQGTPSTNLGRAVTHTRLDTSGSIPIHRVESHVELQFSTSQNIEFSQDSVSPKESTIEDCNILRAHSRGIGTLPSESILSGERIRMDNFRVTGQSIVFSFHRLVGGSRLNYEMTCHRNDGSEILNMSDLDLSIFPESVRSSVLLDCENLQHEEGNFHSRENPSSINSTVVNI